MISPAAQTASFCQVKFRMEDRCILADAFDTMKCNSLHPHTDVLSTSCRRPPPQHSLSWCRKSACNLVSDALGVSPLLRCPLSAGFRSRYRISPLHPSLPYSCLPPHVRVLRAPSQSHAGWRRSLPKVSRTRQLSPQPAKR